MKFPAFFRAVCHPASFCTACLTGTVLLAPLSLWAATYQWKDAQGHTVISDQPPPGNIRALRTMGENVPAVTTTGKSGNAGAGGTPTAAGTSATPAAGTAPQRSLAEQELEFRKRRQATQEKEAKDAADKAAATERQENCTRTRNQMTALQSGTPIFQYNSKGERLLMEDRQREQEMERLRKAAASLCGG